MFDSVCGENTAGSKMAQKRSLNGQSSHGESAYDSQRCVKDGQPTQHGSRIYLARQCHAITALLWNTVVSDLRKTPPRIKLENVRVNHVTRSVRFSIVSSFRVGDTNAGAVIAVLLA